MYAIIETGGKQYKVTEGTLLKTEKLESESGNTFEFDKVLMVGDCENPMVGSPFLKGVKVVASIVTQLKDKKVLIFKKKRRKNYRKKQGHRQRLTKLKVEKIIVE